MIYRYILFSLFFYFSVSLSAQENSIQSINVNLNGKLDYGYKLLEVEDGYLILNYSNYTQPIPLLKIWNGIVKTDFEGNVQWMSDYSINDFGGTQIHQNLFQIEDTLYLSYFANASPSLMALDIQNGDTLWTKQYMLGNEFTEDKLLLQKDNHLYYLVGGDLPFDPSLKLLCLNTQGNILWSKDLLTNYKTKRPVEMVESKDGGFWLGTGLTQFLSPFDERVALIKLDSLGNQELVVELDSTQNSEHWMAPHLVECDNGDVIITSIKEDFKNAFEHFAPVKIIRMTSSSSILWEHTFYDLDQQFVCEIKEMANGDIVGVGLTGIGHEGTPGENGGGGWIFRFSPDGQLLWERRILDLELAVFPFMSFSDFIERPDGSLILTGMVIEQTPDGATDENILLMTLNANGCFTADCSQMDLSPLTQAFAPIGAQWHYQDFSSTCQSDQFTKLEVIKDTLVDNRHCRLVGIFKNNDPVAISYLIVYEQERRIYFYENEEFKLLYDFNESLSLFDTVTFHIPENRHFMDFSCSHQEFPLNNPYKIKIIEMDWVMIDGVNRRRYVTQPIQNEQDDCFEMGTIIEKVGSLNGLAGFSCAQCLQECIGHFRCYHDSETFYQTSIEACDFISSILQVKPDDLVQVYPNPATDQLRIKASTDLNFQEYQIFDSYGKLVQSGVWQSTVSLVPLSTGIYWMELIKDDDNRYVYKFLVQ